MTKKNEENGDSGFGNGLGSGKLNLDGLFKGVEKLVGLATELEEAGGEVTKEGELDLGHLKEGMKGIYGFSIKTAAGGRAVVEPFGNIKKTPQGSTVDEVREPITDVFDEKDEVRVYAEMPGINGEDIELDLKGDILDIAVSTGDRKYQKELLLPATVKAETLASNYKNGILEIKMAK